MARLPDKEIKRRVRAYEKYLKKGATPTNKPNPNKQAATSLAATELNLSRVQLAAAIKEAARRGFPANHDLYTVAKGSEQDVDLPLPEKQRMSDKISELEERLRSTTRLLNHQEDVERIAMGLKDYPLEPPKWTHVLGQGSKKREVPTLFTSDFQFGEVVDLEEMDGINEYDVSIACKRYDRLLKSSVDLCLTHTANPNFPGFLYLRGGDAISGAIHPELMETDELTPPEAVVQLAQYEIAGIELLAEKFGRVHVVSIPGNHGRITLKPRHKKYSALNWESMITAMIELWFQAKRDDRVTFYTPKSGDAYFPIWGMRFLMTHGDRIGTRGGQGFIGPIATISRGFAKIRRQYQQWNKQLDVILTGHYHTSCMPPGGMGNGSLIGYNEFARDFRCDPEPPCQWLFMVHPEWGITQRREIYVDKPRIMTPGSDMWTAVPDIG